jgi:hypothetical protein
MKLNQVFWKLGVNLFCLAITHSAGQIALASTDINIEYRGISTDEENDTNDRSQGGGTRPGCTDAQLCPAERLTIVTPVEQQEGGSLIRETLLLTTQEFPEFWVYIPYDVQALRSSASFELIDSQGNIVAAQVPVVIDNAPGIVCIKPNLPTALEVNETYSWYFLLEIIPGQPSSDDFVNARVRRVALDASANEQDNQEITELAQAAIFAHNRIWLDTLSVMAGIYDARPDIWSNFISEYSQADLANLPVFPCEP